jgi:hypothetical protein
MAIIIVAFRHGVTQYRSADRLPWNGNAEACRFGLAQGCGS